MGPRPHRRDGRGADRPGLARVLRPRSAAGGVRGRDVARVVAADRVRVRAARPRDPLGQELERGRRAQQRGDRATRDRAPRRPGADRPASGPGRARHRGRRPGSPRTADPARPRPRGPGGHGRAARPGRRGRRGRARARSTASVAGMCPWRNVSRSRYADGSHEASSTLSVSSRPAARSAPDAMTMRCAASANRAGDALGPGRVPGAGGEDGRGRVAVERRPGQMRRRPRPPRGSGSGSRRCGTSPGRARRSRRRGPRARHPATGRRR